MNSNLEELFFHEKAVIADVKNKISQHKEDEISRVLIDFSKEYEKLLKQTMKIFKISDKNQLTLYNIQNQLQSLLDNSDQGFLSFGEDLKIDAQYSLECKRVFGEKIAGQNCIDVIFKNTNEGIEENIINAVFSAESDEKKEIYLSLLPEEIIINENIIHIKYKYIDNLNKIMVILTDITEKRKLENNIELERNNLRLIVLALTRNEDFKLLTNEYKDYFNYIIFEEIGKSENVQELLDAIYQKVHTFKGNFGQWYMSNTSNYLHGFEEKMNKIKGKLELTKADILNLVINENFLEELDLDLEIIEKSLGRSFLNEDSYILVDKNKIVVLEEKIKHILSETESNIIIKEIRKLRSKKLSEVLENYKEMIVYNAKKYKKEICSYNIETCGEIYVDTEKYKSFFSALIHIFINMVIHGIESPEIRNAYGKDTGGNINCAISQNKEDIILSIRDDGQGIDKESLIAQGTASGIFLVEEAQNKTDAEIMEMIFLPGISTLKNVTKEAGRGYGLSALKEEIRKLKGRIVVKSEKNKGTEFIIYIPKEINITG